MTDLDQARVLYVGDTRRRENLNAFRAALPPAALEAIEAVAMDCGNRTSVRRGRICPQADTKIVFDTFDIAQHANQAVDQVRRQEHRALRAEGKDCCRLRVKDATSRRTRFIRDGKGHNDRRCCLP